MKGAKAFANAGAGGWPAVMLVGAGIELVIGLALVLQIWRRVTVPAAALLFVLLAGVSLVGVQRGVAGCGCFGPLAVPPWATLAFDAAAAVVLLTRLLPAIPAGDPRTNRLFLACLASLSAGIIAGSILYPRPGESTADAHPPGVVVTLNRDALRERTFPHLDQIRIDADLARGAWKLILVRPGNHKCERALRDGECKPEGGERVAVVLVDPDPTWALPRVCPAVLGQLREGVRWDFELPMVLRLADGRVIEAR
jgi:hypothetical protein